MRSLVVSHATQDPIAINLKNVLRSRAGSTEPASANFLNAEDVTLQTEPELVVVVLPQLVEKGLEIIQRLRPHLLGHLLVVGKATEPKVILRALQDGADHFLDEAELETALGAALARLFNRRATNARTGRLLALLSVSGGCGASTLAVNLAAVLAKEEKHCCLVDLNLAGDLAALLDVKLQFTLADLCVNHARMDRAVFEKMITHHESGIDLLCSPPLFEDVCTINPQGVSQALSLARRLYEHVVVDLEDCFHEEQVLALQQASGIFLVCRLDFASLRNSRRVLNHLEKLDIPRDRIKLIINKCNQPHDLPVDEAEEALGEKFAGFVPSDPKIISAANNTGIPVILKEPQSKVAQSLNQLARMSFDREAALVGASSLVLN